MYFVQISPQQCRMARYALNWSKRDLHKASGCCAATIRKLEGGKNLDRHSVRRMAEAFLDTDKIEFIGSDTVRVIEPGKTPPDTNT